VGKYDAMKIVKDTKARTSHQCDRCGRVIAPGETYYREQLRDPRINTMGLKKYCSECFKLRSEGLVSA
jgi:hypothetical protein